MQTRPKFGQRVQITFPTGVKRVGIVIRPNDVNGNPKIKYVDGRESYYVSPPLEGIERSKRKRVS